MAAPTIVYDDVAEGGHLKGELFAGKKFWIAIRIPSRNRYRGLIESNGGQVVLLEKQADYLIADHFRKDCPPGSISYEFIEKSIQNGTIANPDDHLAGPPVGATREVGSISRPTKGSRAAYTAEEDRILYKWVRDHEKQGGSVSGNELYKQLEAKYPRHTWQSWRDRYLKQLKDRPPAGLAVPDNAPPSPPSDQSTEQIPPPRSAPNKAKRSSQPHTRVQVGVRRNEQGDVRRSMEPRNPESYTVDDFEKLFEKEDWEELYANVENILEASTKNYILGWENWAKETSQTAEQWRQYFEKVVRPQYLQDPPSKKATIKKKVAQRHEGEEQEDKVAIEDTDEVESVGPSTPKRKRKEATNSTADTDSFTGFLQKFLKERRGRRAMEAYLFWAREENGEKKLAVWDDRPGLNRAEIHETLMIQWNALPDEEKATYLVMEAADKRRLEQEQEEKQDPVPTSEMDTSTVAQETPQYIAKAHEKIMKRIHSGNFGESSEDVDSAHSPKRRKHSPTPERDTKQAHSAGTQTQPLEISSSVSSSSSEVLEEEEEENSKDKHQAQDVDMEDFIQTQLQTQEIDEEEALEEELDEADRPTPTIETDDVQYPKLERLSSPELPSNTPTPRAPRHQPNAFDTQAILSSPSQGFPLAALPRPPQIHTQSQSRSQSPSEAAFPLAAIPRPTQTQAQSDFRSRSPSEAAFPLAALPRPTQTQPQSGFRSRSPSILPSSPYAKQESIASATHSIQEFRHSLNSISDEPTSPSQFVPLPLPHPSRRSSTAPSEGSEDPDPPLSPSEITPFFTEQNKFGFTDEEVTAALKHTRMRPELAIEVLDNWKEGKGVPDKRGVWSQEDDKDVVSGDGVALARLEAKHSCDGWGGITERLRFLEKCRGKVR